jgi:hypothetical protein
MRKLPLLFLGFAFITMGLKAQITSPGWFRAGKQPSPPQPRSSFKTSSPIRANGHFTPLFQTQCH